MRNYRGIITKYAVTVGVAGLMTLFILWLRDYSSAVELVDKYHILSDAFTVPGILLVMFGALVWVSSDGFFDGLGYSFVFLKNMLIPGAALRGKRETFYDYKKRKSEKRPGGYGFLFFVGIAFTAVAVVFVILYSTVS